MDQSTLVWLERQRDHIGREAVDICQALVRTNTVNPYSGDPNPGGEAAGQAVIKPWLEEAGATVTEFEPPADIYARMNVAGPPQRSFVGRPNLVAEFTLGSGIGPRILLQGHMDTIGTQGMTIEPFSGEIRDGRIYGRGTSDMKGGMGAAIAAMRAISRAPEGLNGSVILLSVVDEECDGIGAGALACLERGYRGDVAICVDGSGPVIQVGCNGVVSARVRLYGRGGHAAGTDTTPTALARGLKVAQAIQAFAAMRREKHGMALNLGVFKSGTHHSVVPTTAELAANISYTLAEAELSANSGKGYGGYLVKEAFAEMVHQADASAELEWIKDAIPFAPLRSDHPEMEVLGKAQAEVLGIPPEVVRFYAWTDACYPAYHGKMPTIIFGAGVPGKSHTPDEFNEIDRIVGCAHVLAAYLHCRLSSKAGEKGVKP